MARLTIFQEPHTPAARRRELRAVGRRATNVIAANALAIKRRIDEGAGQTQSEWRVQGIDGLVLVTRPTGSAGWYFYFTSNTGLPGKQARRKLPLGDAEVVSLADARRKAEDARRSVEDGKDPVELERNRHLERAEAQTFSQLFETRMELDTSLKASSKVFCREVLVAAPSDKTGKRQHSVLDIIGHLPANEITPQQIVAVLDRIEARTSSVSADHAKAVISATYTWAMKRKALAINPTAGLGKRAEYKPRERKLSMEELATLWRAVDDPASPLSTPMRLVIKLALATGQRRTEVVGVRVTELQLDGADPVWIIPGETRVKGATTKVIRGRTKNDREQVVPLSPLAADLWRQALETCAKGDIVFPADIDRVKLGKAPAFEHIAPGSVSKAIRRLRMEVGIRDVTTHDLRRTMASWMGDNGIRPDVISKLLNHTPQDITSRVYNHSALEGPKREAMVAWGAALEDIHRTAERRVRSALLK